MAIEFVQDQAYWSRRWQHVVLPVMNITQHELQALLPQADHARPKQLADIVLRDPVFTLQSLRVLNTMPRGSYSSAVVDVNNAVLLLGPQRFIEQFSNFPLLEDKFPVTNPLREASLLLTRNSRLAAWFAWEWGKLRLDVKTEELYLAALLYPLREWLINTDAELQHAVRTNDPRAIELVNWLHTRHAAEIFATLLAKWKFPEHVIDLIAENRQQTPRSQCVFLAVRLAQALARGWYRPEVTEILTMTAEVLKCDPESLWPIIRGVILKEARKHPVPEVIPVARLLPLIPSEDEPEREKTVAIAPAVVKKETAEPKPPSKIDEGVKALCSLDKDTPFTAVISQAIKILQQAFGFERIALFMPKPTRDCLIAKFVVGDDQLKALSIPLTGELLFARLAKKTQTLWLHGDNGPRLKSLLSRDEQHLLGHSHWFAASFCVQGQIVAMIFVDCRPSGKFLDSSLYQSFQQLSQEIGRRLPSGASAAKR